MPQLDSLVLITQLVLESEEDSEYFICCCDFRIHNRDCLDDNEVASHCKGEKVLGKRSFTQLESNLQRSVLAS